MAENEGLYIPIQFSMDEARAALRQLENDAKKSGAGVQEAMGGTGRAAGEANKGILGLKEQMGRGRETAMFFTQSLGEFGPQGRTAQIAISGIAGAFMGGGGLLVALSLAQVGLRLLAEAQQEGIDKAKAYASQARETAAFMGSIYTSAKAFYEGFDAYKLSPVEQFVRGATAGIRSQLDALEAERESLSVEVDALKGSAAAEEYEKKQAEYSALSDRVFALRAALTEETAVARAAAPIKVQEKAESDSKREAERKKKADLEREQSAAAELDAWRKQHAVDMENAVREREYERQQRHETAQIVLAVKGEEEKQRALEAAKEKEIRWRDAKAAEIAELEKRHAAATSAAIKDIASSMFGEVQQLLTSELTSAMQEAGTVNRRFTQEYTRLSRQRRAESLVESGVAKTYAEAQAMVAEESQAAEDAKTAAAKEGMAQRLTAQAIEWGIKAVGALAEQNYPSAALYAAAAAAAGVGAGTLHAQAASLTQGRGFTAEENDQLRGMQSGGAREYGGTGGSSGAGGVTREVVFVIGGAWMTEAEVARSWARSQVVADRLGYSRGSGVTA